MKSKTVLVILVIITMSSTILLFGCKYTYEHGYKIKNTTDKNVYCELDGKKKLVTVGATETWTITEEGMDMGGEGPDWSEMDLCQNGYWPEEEICWCLYFNDNSTKNCGKVIMHPGKHETQKYKDSLNP